jgi:hypothetical protein
VAALAHFAIVLPAALPETSPLNQISDPAMQLVDKGIPTGLVVLAAAVPVLGSCVRLLRGSREFARNRLRYLATYQALVELDERLMIAEPDRLVQELWYAERILENESREWLRLMREAEWYG